MFDPVSSLSLMLVGKTSPNHLHTDKGLIQNIHLLCYYYFSSVDRWVFFTFYMIKQETHIYLIHYTTCQQSRLHGNFHIHVFMNQQVYRAFLRYTKRIQMKMNRKKKWWWHKCKRCFRYKYVFMWYFLWLIVRNCRNEFGILHLSQNDAALHLSSIFIAGKLL